MPHTGDGSIEQKVKEQAEARGEDPEWYWEKYHRDILKTANRNGALDANTRPVHQNARARRKALRAAERGEEEAEEEFIEEEGERQEREEEERPRRLRDFVLGWLIGRETK